MFSPKRPRTTCANQARGSLEEGDPQEDDGTEVGGPRGVETEGGPCPPPSALRSEAVASPRRSTGHLSVPMRFVPSGVEAPPDVATRRAVDQLENQLSVDQLRATYGRGVDLLGVLSPRTGQVQTVLRVTRIFSRTRQGLGFSWAPRQPQCGDPTWDAQPPQCVSCKLWLWPAWQSKKGKWHCRNCRRPGGGRPRCHKCGDLTWDGWNGPATHAREWWCAECWCGDQEEGSAVWREWFAARRAAFASSFAEGGQELTPIGAPFVASGGESAASCGLPALAPPVCAQCGKRNWPSMQSKKGKWHCGSCLRPDGGGPLCEICGVRTWDGWSGNGHKWYCAGCWCCCVTTSSSRNWSAWFLKRREMFAEAYLREGVAELLHGSLQTNDLPRELAAAGSRDLAAGNGAAAAPLPALEPARSAVDALALAMTEVEEAAALQRALTRSKAALAAAQLQLSLRPRALGALGRGHQSSSATGRVVARESAAGHPSRASCVPPASYIFTQSGGVGEPLRVPIREPMYIDMLSASLDAVAFVPRGLGPGLPPPFDSGCCGGPSDWNPDPGAEDANVHWGKGGCKKLGIVQRAREPADIHVFEAFLNKRPGPDGVPVRRRLGAARTEGGGWFRLAWMQEGRRAEQDGGQELPRCGNWSRAWHGCKLESVYSILFNGGLVAGRDRGAGDRFFEGAPGIYVHKDGTASKSENYARFVDLCGDQIFWSTKWEVMVDRNRRVKAPVNTDQWIQEAGSVCLVALWVCGRRPEEMALGAAVARKGWCSRLEANPRDPRWIPDGVAGPGPEPLPRRRLARQEQAQGY